MLHATVAGGPKVTVSKTEIPELPSEHHLLIKVIVSGCNPKDWKSPAIMKNDLNQGDDIAGIVAAVGSQVTNFKVGDKVAAFHEMLQPGGSYAEYALAPDHTAFHVPESISYEEAATIPLAATTAALGLYQRLRLPFPWSPNRDNEQCPLLIYGGASAVGAFAIKMAVISNIHPLICIAGNGCQFVEGLIDRSRGDEVIDYRSCDDIPAAIRKALNGKKLQYTFDAVSENGSLENVAKVLDPHGRMVVVLPGKRYDEIPSTVQLSCTQVGKVHNEAYPGIRRDLSPCGPLGAENDKLAGQMFFSFFGRGLRDGYLTGHPHKKIDGGLHGLETALCNLRDGKASAVKYVIRIDETSGSSNAGVIGAKSSM